MTYLIDIQNASNKRLPLTRAQLKQLASMALQGHRDKAELTIRLVDANDMIAMNHHYRRQNKLTNVLAFPSAIPKMIELEVPFLGDIIICPDVLRTESKQLHKTLKAHWSLIVIHGVLHLLGYDHIKEKDANIMQAIEIKLLAELGFDNPYDIKDSTLE